jgi:NAD(P)-dependent dehydrogenase (short-subunit alcohol dehydrogenase family)
MPSLQDKIVVITGSTRGFGRAVAEALLKAGATVVVSGRKQVDVDRVVEELRPLGSVSGRACDVSDLEQVLALARHALTTWGRFDIWINNAGVSTAAGRLIDFPPEDALATFRVNDLGAFHGTKVAMAHFLPRDEGVLVNIYGAGSFLKPATPMGLYGMTKAWLTSFTRTLAKEHKSSGVQIIGFSPGMMLTDMLTRPAVLGEEGEAMLEKFPFVLRVLGQPPEKPAHKLTELLADNRKSFVEYRTIKPWTFPLGMLNVLWENISGRSQTPEFELQIRPPDRVSLEEGVTSRGAATRQ